MNFCAACQELDGKHFSVAPHADLAFMSEHGGGMSDWRLMMKSWRCQSCATWMRQHTQYGENPEMWEAVIQLNPWVENGYQVHGEARAMLACKNLEAWYWIEAPGERFPILLSQCLSEASLQPNSRQLAPLSKSVQSTLGHFLLDPMKL